MQYQAWLWINSVAKMHAGYISTGYTHHLWHYFIEETCVFSATPHREKKSLYKYIYSISPIQVLHKNIPYLYGM